MLPAPSKLLAFRITLIPLVTISLYACPHIWALVVAASIKSNKGHHDSDCGHECSCRGYLAPEYASLGQLSEKVDVFSFGVLCLEVVSGRRNIDETQPADEVYLSNWVRFLCS
jgi:hypothetical protein